MGSYKPGPRAATIWRRLLSAGVREPVRKQNANVRGVGLLFPCFRTFCLAVLPCLQEAKGLSASLGIVFCHALSCVPAFSKKRVLLMKTIKKQAFELMHNLSPT